MAHSASSSRLDASDSQTADGTSAGEFTLNALSFDAARFISPNPHDINQIFATTQLVPCRFMVRAPKLGFLDPSCESEDIEEDTKLELPLWLAQILHARQIVRVDPPQGFNEVYREIFEADAKVVDLRKLCPQFYQVGSELATMGLKESSAIAKSLTDTFEQRFHPLMDFASSGTQKTIAEMLNFKSKLDDTELELFKRSRESIDEYKRWCSDDFRKLRAHEIVEETAKQQKIIQKYGKSTQSQASQSQSASQS